MHLCSFNKEFKGLGYNLYEPTHYIYGISTFDLWQCKKCKGIYRKNVDLFRTDFRDTLQFKLNTLQKIGYKPIGDLIK